ncbi:MAG: lignostilbene-alpha,beta-dioxygenase [Cyanobacteria bacterium]|jgi:carotenoid cleavage dioxygenase-like enzyme|nr:lignostilbene-alpha,beta-dioxygenase [Cyanobacteria bacterium GSL.Bin21]
MSDQSSQASVLIPASILRASRCELSDLSLEIVAGQLPTDLRGHFFMVAPVGSVNSGGLPYPEGDSVLNGDGMIYRLDFLGEGQVNGKTKLVTPPDYYADVATRPGTPYSEYGFRNRGIIRFSSPLGFRNQLNTAFLPMPFSNTSPQRLLVTYDGGRPYEVDTETLETVTPVGANSEWKPELNWFNAPFQPFLSSAHPTFDGKTGEMFTVNYSRSLENFLKGIPFFSELGELPEEIDEFISAIAGFYAADLVKQLLQTSWQLSQRWIDYGIDLIENISGIKLKDFVYLIRWQGDGHLERWKLVLSDGSPVIIKQTIHQIAVTQNYVILMDTSFVTGVEQLFNHPFPENKPLEETLREILGQPQYPDAVIYLVSRGDLKNGQQVPLGDPEVQVVAKKVTIPLEAAHFLADYENPDGKITLHIAHICAWDVADWIRQFDRSPYGNHAPSSPRVYGMEVNGMDISRLGRYVIDGNKGSVIASQIIKETPYTWGPGLYAYLDRLSSGEPPARLENIYWYCFGLWEELMTHYNVEIFRDYKYRAIPMREVLALGKEGIPACLFRVQTSDMVIADQYQFPSGCMGSSPQFIPKWLPNQEGFTEDSKTGYLVCTVFTPERSEFWVFDAEKLEQGPICKLFHPALKFGFSLHTTWLPTIGKRDANYNIPVALDYEPILTQQCDPKIRELFEQAIFPHFPS